MMQSKCIILCQKTEKVRSSQQILLLVTAISIQRRKTVILHRQDTYNHHNFYLSTQQMSCPVNCGACNGSACTGCDPGYSLSGSTCIPTTTTCTTNCGSADDGTNTGLIVGIVIGAIVLIIIIILIIYLLFCREKGKSEPSEPRKDSDAADSANNLNRESDNLERGAEKGVDDRDNEVAAGVVSGPGGAWRDIMHGQVSSSKCCLCESEEPDLLSACGHYFHIECVADYSKNKDGCSQCKVMMKNKKHTIFCKDCFQKEMVVDFDEIVKMDEEGTTRNDAICQVCRAKQD